MRAGIYVRISRDITGQGLGVQRQEEDCRGHADALGWEVAEVYIDNDISATSGKVRPAYQRMLADLVSGDIGAIVAWHPDRLYRRVTDLADLVDACKRVNGQIATVQSSHVDLSSPTGRMVAGILAQVAMYEVEHKSERWSRSWRQGRETGAPVTNSSRLFGYERDGVTINEAEAAVTRELATRVIDGESQGSLLRWLRDSGIRTTQGNVWGQSGFKTYMTNPRIAGYSTLRGEIVGEGMWPPLLERPVWETVRSLLTSRTRAYVPRKSLLNGLIFCGRCEARMITTSLSGVRYYRCPDRPHLPGCGRILGKAEAIEEVVESYSQARWAMPEVRERVAALSAEPTGAQNELADLELRVRELEQQLEAPGMPVTTILRAIERARERQAHLMDKIAAAPRGSLPTQGGPWPSDLRRRRTMVDLVVKRVNLLPSTGGNRFRPERVKIDPR